MLNKEKELLNTLENVANEKNISKEVLFTALSEALRVSIIKHLNEDADIQVSIDKHKAKYIIYRQWTVVPDNSFTNPARQIPLTKALAKDAHISINEKYIEELPIKEFGRIAINAGKKVISQIIKNENSRKILAIFDKEIPVIIQGRVIHISPNKFILNILNTEQDIEVALPISEILPSDRYRLNDIIKCSLLKAHIDALGDYHITVSRKHKNFLYAILSLEIPEIREHIIQIKDIVRDPGVRSKVSVFTTDPKIDPVGTCIGVRGKRIQAVSKELHNENIDIIRWSSDPVEYTVNAFSGIEIISIIRDDYTGTMLVSVAKENISQAIGIHGINASLISLLTGWKIKIISADIEENLIKELDLSDFAYKKLSMNRIFTINDLITYRDKVKDILNLTDQESDILQKKAQHVITAKTNKIEK